MSDKNQKKSQTILVWEEEVCELDYLTKVRRNLLKKTYELRLSSMVLIILCKT